MSELSEAQKSQEEKDKKKRKFWVITIVFVSVMASTFSFYGYQIFFEENFLIEYVDDEELPEEKALIIPKGATWKMVKDSLEMNGFLHKRGVMGFALVSKLAGYQEAVKPGYYIIEPGMSNKDVVSKLMGGRQDPVKVTFRMTRRKEQLAERMAKNIGLSTEEILAALNSEKIAADYGFGPKTIISMFRPNTYEVYYTISQKDLFDKMKAQYDAFWTPSRLALLDSTGFTKDEVFTFASIVDGEVRMKDEMPKVAGVYYNRMKYNMKLQADITICYALNEYRRLYHSDYSVVSEYSTYYKAGLPPGPINTPSDAAIDAVLKPKKHKYLYYVVDAENTNYHKFAESLKEHNKYSAELRKYLKARNNKED